MTLRRVTKGEPCAICGRPDWCGVSGDGGVAVCMRIAEGSARTAANGGFVHVLRESPRAATTMRRNQRSRQPNGTQPFTPAMARQLWETAVATGRDDAVVDECQPVWDFLATRNLMPAWEASTFGVLTRECQVPQACAFWAGAGYQLVCPLHGQDGRLAGIQARNVVGREPKTLFPRGQATSGLVFANDAGLGLLRGERANTKTVIYGEGLTDHLALTIATTKPVLCAPGASFLARGIGRWVKGLTLVLVVDNDEPSERHIRGIVDAAHANGASSVSRAALPEGCKDICDLLARGVEAVAGITEGGGESQWPASRTQESSSSKRANKVAG